MNNEENNFVINAISPDGKWLSVFEDDGETGYLYFCSMSPAGDMLGISDALWIYNQIYPTIYECKEVHVVWSKDSLQSALIVDNELWGMFDLASKRKLNASRENNSIVTIPVQVWQGGIPEDLGEPLDFVIKQP